ncbi:hypothetical protein KFE98_08095 [bacterium SCSIO 12741]|nr:hypothetical protein KFE98_08095 [bacterium SCSIO 12741]
MKNQGSTANQPDDKASDQNKKRELKEEEKKATKKQHQEQTEGKQTPDDQQQKEENTGNQNQGTGDALPYADWEEYEEEKDEPQRYRDDFYRPENIIGHTGDLNKNPTVYFRKGNEVGRITQKFDRNPLNEGREKVRSMDGYSIDNYYVPDEVEKYKPEEVDRLVSKDQDQPEHGYREGLRSVEIANNEKGESVIKHFSRKEFHPADQSEPEEIETLSKAIDKHPNLKPKNEKKPVEEPKENLQGLFANVPGENAAIAAAEPAEDQAEENPDSEHEESDLE